MPCCRVTAKAKDAKKAIEAGKIEWQFWGNSLASFGSFCMVLGGVITCTSTFETTGVGIHSIIAGVIVFVIEWPRSKRQRGRTLPRYYLGISQHKITPLVTKLGLLHNLFARFLLYTMLAIPCFFELPTILGGAVVVMSALVYLIAAFKNEQWKPLAVPKQRGPSTGQFLAAPQQPPPRLPSDVSDTVPIAPKESAKAPSKATAPAAAKPVAASRPTAPGRAVPEAPARAPPGPPATRPASKPEWVAHKDKDSGEVYYENSATKKTQWQRPHGSIEMDLMDKTSI